MSEEEKLGQYPVQQQLERTTTFSLYRGPHPTRKKQNVLLKVFHAPLTSPEIKDAFVQRAKQLKKLTHRNTVRVLDYGLERSFTDLHDCGYLALDYVEGISLENYRAGKPSMKPDEVKRLLTPLAQALTSAHHAHILHGNLHPGSLLINKREEPLISDFRMFLPDLDDEKAGWHYQAPEQLQGQPIPASDQYSLAIMVYEWLCGQLPYHANTAEELLHKQRTQAFLAPHEISPAISENASQVIMRALSFKPEERFEQADTFATHYLYALMGMAAPTSRPQPALPSLSPLTIITKKVPLVFTNQPEDPSMAAISPPKSSSEEPGLAPERVVAMAEQLVREKPDHYPQDHDPIGEHPEDQPTPKEDLPPLRVRPKMRAVDGGRLHARVSADLQQGGELSRSLPGYEERPAQVQMANLVAQSLEENIPAVVEAATGTGKSLAYLVPVVRSGKVAIISTANKALQEQLFYKDIPFVQKHIQDFEASLVKGMGNYVCLDRMDIERVGLQFHAQNREFEQLVDLTQRPESGFTGDFETLDFKLPQDIRSRIMADTDQCAWNKCNFFTECYIREMRERARQAQVIVVNHTLLLLDAAMDGFLLPERDVIIIDEAHHLEDEATRAFTITVSPSQITTLLAQRMLKDHSQLSLQDQLKRFNDQFWGTLEQIADPGYKGRINLQEPVEDGKHLASLMEDLADSLRKQRPKDLPEKEAQLYDKLLKRAQNLTADLRTVFSVDQPERFVYYVERVSSGGRRGYTLNVSAAPLNIKSWLQERLINKCNVICTSATLATSGPNSANPEQKGPNFAYFRKRVGLNPEDVPEVLESILPLTFDYEQNALLYLPRQIPEPAYGDGPAAQTYTRAIAREMGGLIRRSRGRAFLLFSSKRMLDDCFHFMNDEYENLTRGMEQGFTFLKQGDMTRLELTRKFRESDQAVLFGLKSFWEGVDIAGDALSLVVIDKLPFDPPDDPVHEARVAKMKAAGENWFGTYVLPQAILRLKQGIGRLLRSREDRGVMAILDARLQTKGYGRMILNALPPARRTSNLRDVDDFFAQQ